MKEKTKNIEENRKKSADRAAAPKEKYSLRGRKFEGYVIKKFDKRVVIKFERVNFIRKYERYLKTWTKLHARLPENMKNEINIGDYIQIMECRPLSKIIHFVAVKKIRNADNKESQSQQAVGYSLSLKLRQPQQDVKYELSSSNQALKETQKNIKLKTSGEKNESN